MNISIQLGEKNTEKNAIQILCSFNQNYGPFESSK